jgi:hypothetical protein
LGLEFYRALNRLAAVALPHFDREETALMPRLWATLSEDEIAAIRGSIMAAIGPDEAAYALELADGALDPSELTAIHQLAAARQLVTAG